MSSFSKRYNLVKAVILGLLTEIMILLMKQSNQTIRPISGRKAISRVHQEDLNTDIGRTFQL
jgi:hypothetical protein